VSSRSSVTILHISDTQFGSKHRFGNDGLTSGDQRFSRLATRLLDDIDLLRKEQGLTPDLIVVSGDLAETGSRSEFTQVRDFLAELTEGLRLGRDRVAIVPGNHDINWRKCQAYFLDCEADETDPVPPYWPKWEHYAAMFAEFYADVPGVGFPKDQPWTLFEMPELKTVVAGLNSTMAESHLPEHHHGFCGEEQLRWFADRLRARAADGWLRIGALHHNPVILDQDDSAFLRDHHMLAELLAPYLNLMPHGHTHAGKLCSFGPDGVPVLCAGSAGVRQDARPEDTPNQYQLVQVLPTECGCTRAGTTRRAIAGRATPVSDTARTSGSAISEGHSTMCIACSATSSVRTTTHCVMRLVTVKLVSALTTCSRRYGASARLNMARSASTRSKSMLIDRSAISGSPDRVHRYPNTRSACTKVRSRRVPSTSLPVESTTAIARAIRVSVHSLSTRANPLRRS